MGELVRKARSANIASLILGRPADVSGRLGFRSSLPVIPSKLADEAYGLIMEAKLAVIVDDVPMGCDIAYKASAAIRLIMLVQ